MPVDPLSSHVLDTVRGTPGCGIQTTLYQYQKPSETWQPISTRTTDADGRVSDFIKIVDFTAGIYKLHFDTKSYYDRLNMETFYPFIEIIFEVQNSSEHYHVPILLNPFGYTTYRGS